MKTILEQPPTFETPRLRIRPLTMEDDEAIFSYGSDPEVSKYVLFNTHTSISDTREFLRTVLDQYAEQKPCALGVVLRSTSKLVGSVGYLNWSDDHKRIEIGCALSRPSWHKGYGQEAAAALINYLFSNSDLNRIEARCRVENSASAKVLENSGLQYEGTLRKHIFSKGEFRDMKIYSIIRDEWQRNNSNF